jgi:hypothetical protein
VKLAPRRNPLPFNLLAGEEGESRPANLGLVMPLYRLTLATILPAGAFYLTYAMTARLARGLRSSSFAAQSGVVTR